MRPGDGVRQRLRSGHIHQLTQRLDEGQPLNIKWLSAMRHAAIMSIIIGLWRLHEVRSQFLVPWLFSDKDLTALGVPPMDQFLRGSFKSFKLVRHQYVGHATARKASGERPGSIIRPEALGRAIRDTGLRDSAAFLARVQQELVPGIEKAVQELVRRNPEADTYLRETYPIALQQAIAP
jgi:hypothetical protein